ncbi:hypothetical protein [Rhizobium sp. BE258]|uniref:hypothetical protein n=1 Tax=Rhizobium sp. BE258 TaxID=2817722 RepID=UPI00285A0EAA|nr:hypothetical protein [Rhizobium sp. BE258]MDR7147059.1 hypothetical protein [Rhizobium sp. BE258]
MVDTVTVKRTTPGSQFERELDVSLSDLARNTFADPEWIPAGPLILSAKHQGKCLVFAGASTVTIPSSLPEGFSCGFVQAGAGQVTFVAGAGATVNSQSGLLKTAAQWAVGGMSSLSAGTFLLYGGLA